MLYLYILCVCYDMGLATLNKTYDDDDDDDYIRSSTSTKLSKAVKMHENLQIVMAYFKICLGTKPPHPRTWEELLCNPLPISMPQSPHSKPLASPLSVKTRSHCTNRTELNCTDTAVSGHVVSPSLQNLLLGSHQPTQWPSSHLHHWRLFRRHQKTKLFRLSHPHLILGY